MYEVIKERGLASNRLTKESFMVGKAFELGSEKFAPSPLNTWRKNNNQSCRAWDIRGKKINAEEISACLT